MLSLRRSSRRCFGSSSTMYLDKQETTGGFMTSRRRQKAAADIARERDNRRLKGMPVRDFGSMNASDLCGAFSAAARNKVADKKIWKSLQNRALFLMGIMAPANVAVVMNSLARAQLEDFNVDLIAAVTEKVVEQREAFQWNDLGLLVNAYARLQLGKDDFFKVCSDIVIKCRGSGMNEKDIARFVNAYAKMGIRDDKLFAVLGGRILECESTFTELSLSNIANGYAKLDIRDLDVFRMIARELDARLLSEGMKSQHVANILHAYAKLHIWDAPVIWERLVKRLLPKMLAANEFSPLEVSAVAGALSKAIAAPVNSSSESQVDCRTVLPPMAATTLANLKDYHSHEIANVLHALSTIHQHTTTPYCHSESELWSEAVPELIIDKGSTFQPHSMSMILCAFGRVGRAIPRRALTVIEGRLEKSSGDYNDDIDTPNLVNQLYALGRLGLSTSPLVGIICEAIDRGPPLKEEAMMVNTYYALSKLYDGSDEGPTTALLRRITNQFCMNGHNYDFTPQHIANILHASCDLSVSLTKSFTGTIASRILDRWEGFAPQLYGSALLSCAKLKIDSDELWKSLLGVSRRMMKLHSDCRCDRDVVVALTTMGVADRDLWQATVSKQLMRVRELPLPILTSTLYAAAFAGYSNVDYLTEISSEALRRSRNVPVHLVEAVGRLMRVCVDAEILATIAPWDVMELSLEVPDRLTDPLGGNMMTTFFEVSSIGSSGNAFSHILRLMQVKAAELGRDELLVFLQRWSRVGEEDFMEPLLYAMEKMIIDQPIDLLTLAKASKYLGPGQRRGLSRATRAALENLDALPTTAIIACSAILLPQVDLTCRGKIFEVLSRCVTAVDVPLLPVLQLCRAVCDLQPPVVTDSLSGGAMELGRCLKNWVTSGTVPAALLSAIIVLDGDAAVDFERSVLSFDGIADVCRLLEACKLQPGRVDGIVQRCLTYSPSGGSVIVNGDFTLASRYLRAAGEALMRTTKVDYAVDLTILREFTVWKSPSLQCSVSALLFSVARLETVKDEAGSDLDMLANTIAELLDRLSRYKGQLSSEADARVLKRCVEVLKKEHKQWYFETIPVSVRSALDKIRVIVEV